MNYVLINGDGHKFLLSEKEKEGVFAAIQQKANRVILQGQMLSLQIIPNILKYDFWFAQEQDRLGNQQKKMCKKCLGIVKLGDRCTCFDGYPAPNPFSLPSSDLTLKLNPPQNEQ